MVTIAILVIYMVGCVISFFLFMNFARKERDIRIGEFVLVIMYGLCSWVGVTTMLIYKFLHWLASLGGKVIIHKK